MGDQENSEAQRTYFLKYSSGETCTDHVMVETPAGGTPSKKNLKVVF